MYFLLQIPKIVGIEEFNQRDTKTVAQHFNGDDPGVLTFSVENVFDGGWRNRRFGGKLVYRHMLFLQKCKQSVFYGGISIHIVFLLV